MMAWRHGQIDKVGKFQIKILSDQISRLSAGRSVWLLQFVFIFPFQRCEQEVVLYDAEDGGEDWSRDGHQVTALHVTVEDGAGQSEMSICLLVLQDDGHYRESHASSKADEGQEQENKK